ncbi:signal transduction histidine kinase [Flavobacterium limnosediminis JC2902]|uniref:histidine kinase n=2 Tax=Flavobacterium TaxID=237 RepID=V6SIZ6_9FLAO|nr:signal transduction histidine kinase [Flavobacterium limnosediminis JC2902]
MRALNENLQTLYADRLLPLEHLGNIRYSYGTILLTVKQTNEGEINYAEARKKIQECQDNINNNWNTYLLTYLTPEENKLADETTVLLNKSNLSINQLKDALDRKDVTAFKKISGTPLYPTLLPLRDRVSTLIKMQLKVSKTIHTSNIKSYNSASKKFIFIIGFTLVITALLSHYLIKNINDFIKELRESNKKIKEAEKQYRYLFKNSPACNIIWDPKTLNILEVNDAVIEKYGYRREELTNMTVLQLRPEKDHEKMKEHAKNLLNGMKPSVNMASTHLKKNGEEMRMEITSHKIIYNNHTAILALANDVTELLLAVNRLKSSEERLIRVMENSPIPMAITLSNQEIVFFNKQFTEVFGYTTDDVPSTDEWWPLAYPEENYREIVKKEWFDRMERTNTTNTRFEPMEAKVCCKNGSSRFIEFNYADLEDEYLVIFHDITDRKLAEEKIRTSEERYKSIITVSNTGAWEYHLDNGYLWCSPEYFSMLGRKQTDYDMSGNENLQETWIDLLHPEDFEKASNHFAEYLKNGSVGTYENYFRMQHINGDWIWIWSRGQTLRDEKGNLTNLTVGTHIDITQRKKIEKELEQSEEKHRALIENISDTIILINEDLEITYRSPSYMRNSGLMEKDYNTSPLTNLFHPDDLPNCLRIIEQARTSFGKPIPIQFRTSHNTEQYKWVEGTLTNLLHNESVKHYVINYRDITERKKFEEQQLLITSIVNSSDDAIISKSLDGIVTSWNHGAEQILGYSAEEIIGKHISAIIPTELLEEDINIIEKIKMGISVDHYETQRRKKDGELLYASLTISPIINTEGRITGASMVLRDTSYSKIMELEREKTISELLQRNRDLQQFSYIVSHNLRGPVATIIGLTDLLSTKHLSETEKKTMWEGINTSVHKLDDVIKDLNNILVVKSQISEKKENIQLSALLGDLKKNIANIVQKENVQFFLDFDAVNEITTLKSYMYSILYNLVSNSIKYRQPNLDPVIEIKTELTAGKVILIIKDNCLGIDLINKGDQVFGLYKRFHFHTEGKGMGLYMVKTQVEALDGKISIKSEVNKGTEFRIEFENQ